METTISEVFAEKATDHGSHHSVVWSVLICFWSDFIFNTINIPRIQLQISKVHLAHVTQGDHSTQNKEGFHSCIVVYFTWKISQFLSIKVAEDCTMRWPQEADYYVKVQWF